jgi:uncharacterized protein (DUF1697 family)
MPAYVALIRGINVGGKKKLAMADLRELLSRQGYRDVRTHLNSGNAVFTAPGTDPAELAELIEQAMESELGLSVRCLVRSGAELRAVVAANPLAEHATEGSKLVAHFLSAAPDPTLLTAHDPCDLAPETIVFGDRVIYQWCPDGILAASPAGTFAEKYLGVTVTARNWNTVLALRARA